MLVDVFTDNTVAITVCSLYSARFGAHRMGHVMSE